MVDWYVVFTPPERETWYTRFLEPGFGHCYMVRWDGFNWLRIRPDLSHCHIEILPVADSASVEDVVRGNVAVYVEVPAEQARIRIPWLITLATCTEACKAVLGIRTPLVITPYQLFNYLVARKHERWWRRGHDPRTEKAPEPATAGVREGQAG